LQWSSDPNTQPHVKAKGLIPDSGTHPDSAHEWGNLTSLWSPADACGMLKVRLQAAKPRNQTKGPSPRRKGKGKRKRRYRYSYYTFFRFRPGPEPQLQLLTCCSRCSRFISAGPRNSAHCATHISTFRLLKTQRFWARRWQSERISDWDGDRQAGQTFNWNKEV